MQDGSKMDRPLAPIRGKLRQYAWPRFSAFLSEAMVSSLQSCWRNLPTIREFKGSVVPAAGGIHIRTIVLRRFADLTAARERAVKIGGQPETIDDSGGMRCR
jgi:hypothetical protein